MSNITGLKAGQRGLMRRGKQIKFGRQLLHNFQDSLISFLKQIPPLAEGVFSKLKALVSRVHSVL